MKINRHRSHNRQRNQTPKKSGIFSKIIKKCPQTLKGWFILFAKIGLSLFIALVLYALLFLPSVKNAEQLNFAESTIIYDREALNDGVDKSKHILYKIHGDENREYIPLNEISKYVPMSTIAIEDDGFYHHFGFDVGGIVKAVLNRFLGIGSARGGSTITQQLVKQVFLSSEKTFARKFNELLLSIKVELVYSKDEILELYLNKISYGNNSHGIEAAAQNYFGKSARNLTLAESVILAGIPQAPSRYNPYGSNKDLLMGYYDYKEYTPHFSKKSPLDKGDLGGFKKSKASEVGAENLLPSDEDSEITEEEEENKNKLKVYKKGRKDLVLQRLLDLDKISSDEFYQAWANSNYITFQRNQANIKAPHFVFYVREQLEEKYGKEFLTQGGLQIFTTLDPDLQKIAEETIQRRTEFYKNTYGASNAAMTSINPETGEILAYIGGRDFFDIENDGQVDVLRSFRQPGSSFKPMVYAAGFDKGFSPARVTFDVETDFGSGYKPRNFDEKYHGPVSFRKALNHSYNVPAIKMAFLATPKYVLELASKLGIKYKGNADTHGVAIGVGVAEVQPLSHIAAYQAFVGDGTYHLPSSILEIRDAKGKVLEKNDFEKMKTEGLESSVAGLVRSVLTDETARPNSWNKLLNLKKEYNSGAKTGTSNKLVKNSKFNKNIPESKSNTKFTTLPGDSWTIGFTPHLVTGVWVGNNRGQALKSGATGLTVAAPIWRDYMRDAHEKIISKGADPEKDYIKSELTKKTVNKYSGLLASKITPKSLFKNEYFAPFAVQTRFDNSLQPKSINILTGEVADEKTPQWLQKEVLVLNIESIRPDLGNWVAPAKRWQKEHPLMVSNDEVINLGEDWKIPENFLTELPEALKRKIQELQNSDKDIDWEKLVFDEDAPKIKILSPSKNTATGRIRVEVKIDKPQETESVEYYLDGDYIYESKRFPFTGKFVISADHEVGSSHTIEAKTIGKNFGTSSDKITVTIVNDQTAPQIRILSPQTNQKFPINSQVEILAEINDFDSSIRQVEFFLNGNSIAVMQRKPFKKTIFMPSVRGRQELKIKATDTAGNIQERKIPIHTVREIKILGKKAKITEVKNQRDSVLVKMVFPKPENILSAQIFVGQKEQIIFQKDWKGVSNFIQVAIPKGKFKGMANIDLYVQEKNQKKAKVVDSKKVKF